MTFHWIILSLVSAAAGLGDAANENGIVEKDRLQDAGMYRYWQAQLPLASGDSVDQGFLVDDAIYVTTHNGTLFALASKTGLLHWGEKVADPDYTIYPPSHIRMPDDAGPVIIPTTTEVLVFDRFSGDRLKRFIRPFPAGSTAIAMGNKMFMGSTDRKFYSLSVDVTHELAPIKRWEVLSGGPITATPLLYSNRSLVFASQDGTIYSCLSDDKTLLWSHRTSGPITGDPVADTGGVYLASMDRSVYKLHPRSGRVLWQKHLSRPLSEGPVLAAHTLFQYSSEDGLVALDADSGKEKWRLPTGRKFVAHNRKGDVILATDRRLLWVDHETGDKLVTLDTHGLAGVVSNTSDDALFLLGRNGRVECARVDTTPYLRRQRVLAARNRLHLPSAKKEAAEDSKAAGDDAVKKRTARDPLRSRRD
jgi:outer membrane protein assembly factor BamB